MSAPTTTPSVTFDEKSARAWWTSAWIAPVVAVLAYLHTCWFGFVIDDVFQIGENAATHSLGNIPSFFAGDIVKVFNGLSTNYYRPLFWTTLALEFRAFGSHAWGYHLVNVLAHALACLLVYRLVVAMGLGRGAATLAAVLFAVQPAHVEAVAWISAIPEMMMVACVIGSLLLYLEFRRSGEPKPLVLAAALFLAGLWFKETAMALPAIIVFYEAAFGEITRAFRPRVLIAYGSAFTAYVISRAVAVPGFFRAEATIPFSVEVLTWPTVLAFYIRHLLVPIGQGAYYDHFYVSGFARAFWMPALVVLAAIGATALLAWLSSQRRLIVFCALSAAVSIVPVLHLRVFMWRELAHDRYLYLSSVFFCIALAALFVHARVSKPARSIVIAGLVVAYAAILVAESLPWRSDVDLYRHAREIAPENVRPKYGYAVELLKQGRRNEAGEQLQEVVRLAPNWFEPRYGLAQIAFAEQRYADAERELLGALAVRPDAGADVVLAAARMRMGNFAAAEQPLRDALALSPSTPGLHFNLGRCLAEQKRLDEARSEFNLEIAAATPYADAAREELSRLGK